MQSMHFSTTKLPWRTWVFFLVFFLFISSSISDPRISVSGLFCGASVQPPGLVSLVPSFVKEMQNLSQLITTRHFATYHLDRTFAFPLYALVQCHHDLSQTDCLLCYANARTRLPRCLPSLSACIFLDGCFLRYDNYSFYRESVSSTYDSVNCSVENVSLMGEDRVGFVRNVGYAVGNVTAIALRNGGFGIVAAEGVYALAQCWDSLSVEGCRECLDKAAKAVKGCPPKKEGRGMNAGCYLRYSTEKFYNDSGDTGHGHGFSELKVISAIALATIAFSMLLCAATYAAYTRFSRMKREHRIILTSFNKSSLNFKYETLEKATDYFSLPRKIGQGGAGSVFMGILPNGRTVAVKRLIFNTRQWVDEFFNEVNLISGIQHKNLVQLLGCSIEGPESLLVYEYVPNRSLDHFIFDDKKSKLLSWKQRFNIIVGTAEGLAYLHGGSQVRIIHRDIKSSNVLLDEDLTPKIADFGLARCLAADKTHLSTGVAGTLGYMAPEYLVRGQLTEKADVYSFGVLILEIACGKRNSAFTKDSSTLLQTVWRLYKLNTLAEAVDPRIRDDSVAKEASRVLQIGLLCTQASVALRPSMAEVVQMLTNRDCEIPFPSQPPFLNAGLLDPSGSSVRSYSTDSFISSAARKIEACCSSSVSSSNHSLYDQASKS
ncbi:hypothetical protein SLEP1_g19483 [Rubroshorea leprosula]|uniref:Cysteine-rich receptor-like protein kinase 42 n=1 Tax=Rubroshorea leprosula TaxID=152421 RepID=A0AAV5J8H0_9ROSI|nr:hypothetical protein SLEP1_g19483 [Rubroshorea leprosula]